MAKIMICDDSRFQRKILQNMVSEIGHDTVLSNNGNELLEKLKNESVDLIFLDLLMPVLTGFDVLEQLQKDGSSIPIVVLSADIQESSQQKCKDLGAFAFLNKPPQKELIIEVLNSVLSNNAG